MFYISAKPSFLVLLVLIAGLSGACTKQSSEAAPVSGAETAPADSRVASALALIEEHPDMPLAYDQLALVYIKKARETGDFEFNKKAEAAVNQALALAPKDIPSRKLQGSLHLTFHRFGEALDVGKQLQSEFPNDAFVYGILTDANAELGNYPEAVAAAQKMVDLKPNSMSYARVARIRSLHGDHQGAVEAYKTAARTTDPGDKEGQSWCLVQLGDELWENGKYEDAEKVYDEALQNFPNFYLAIEGKGRVRAARNDLPAAENFLIDAQNRVPRFSTLVLLGNVYTAQGNAEKAQAQHELVEVVEAKLGAAGDQLGLALFWADRNVKLDEALAIAAREYQSSKNIYTADVYAWTLYKNGRLPEAKAAISEAMRLKTNDARILYHAAMIEKELGNNKEAMRLLESALKLNPAFDLVQAGNARKTLSEIS